MTKSVLSNKEVLLAVVPGDDGGLVLRHAEVSGRRIHATGEGLPPRVVGPTRASLFSPESYFEQVELAAASVKLLPLVARRHVDAELVFDDALYRLRACSRSKRERTISSDIAAVPERDLDDAVSMLPLEQYPCKQMVPLELAIAGLVNKATKEPVIVFWERAGLLISVLVTAGMVVTRMRERVTEESRDEVIRRAEAGLRASAGRSGDNSEVLLSLFMGDLVGYREEQREKAVQTLEKKLTRLYRSGKKVPKDAVLREPELFGLPFVAIEWSFLEADYRNEVLAWTYARPAAALAAAAGVVIALYGGFQHLQALSLGSDFNDRRAELGASLSEFESIRPSDDAMAIVRSRLDVQRESLNEVRLDRMLDWLTHLVPEGVVISALEMAPAPIPRRRSYEKQIEFPTGEKPFEVKMEIVLAETALDDAEASAAEVVRRLSQRLDMVDSRLQVPAPQPGVRRNVVLVVRAEARSVNFS